MPLDRAEVSTTQSAASRTLLPHEIIACMTLPCNLNLPVGTDILEVLIPEDQKLPLRNIKRKFVKSCVAQLGNLDACKFCANVRTDIVRLGTRAKEIWFGGICTGTWVGMFCEISGLTSHSKQY